MFSLQGGGAVQGNGLDLLPEEGGVDEEENTLDDISGDEVGEVFVVLSDILGESCSSKNRLGNWDLAKRNIPRVKLFHHHCFCTRLVAVFSSYDSYAYFPYEYIRPVIGKHFLSSSSF